MFKSNQIIPKPNKTKPKTTLHPKHSKPKLKIWKPKGPITQNLNLTTQNTQNLVNPKTMINDPKIMKTPQKQESTKFELKNPKTQAPMNIKTYISNT